MSLTAYERPSVAAWYGSLGDLFAAERAIAEIVFAADRQIDMVDMGIGGGRTTKQLAHRCRSYAGFDYTAAMVEEAKRNCEPGLNLFQGDARAMRQIPDASANFVLFSFNGLDYMGHDDRLKVLREVRRVCRPGAWFAFSTHNLAVARREFTLKGAHPKELAKWALKQAINFPLQAKFARPYAILNDGVHHFGVTTYYVQPEEQLRQLTEAGFHSPRVFEFNTGKEITGEPVRDSFPYFLCVAP